MRLVIIHIVYMQYPYHIQVVGNHVLISRKVSSTTHRRSQSKFNLQNSVQDAGTDIDENLSSILVALVQVLGTGLAIVIVDRYNRHFHEYEMTS